MTEVMNIDRVTMKLDDILPITNDMINPLFKSREGNLASLMKELIYITNEKDLYYFNLSNVRPCDIQVARRAFEP